MRQSQICAPIDNGDAHDETRFAKTVADHFGSIHRSVRVGPKCVERRLAELSACNDAPVSQPGAVAIAEMSRVSKQWVKVALSGGGADELFAGYPKYIFAHFPAIAGAALRALGPDQVALMSGSFGLDAGRAGIAFRALSQRREVDRMVQWFSHATRQNLRTLLPGLDWTDAAWSDAMATQEYALSRMSRAGPLFRMQAVDCLTWLPSNILESDDRMSMAEGLEMRPAFLDKELVAFALALPDHLKVRGRVGKWMVRAWAAKFLPGEILRRQKWGFKAPLAEWFRGSLGALASDYLMSAHGLCGAYGDRLAISRLIDGHRRGEADSSATLWALMSSEVWYQDVFRSSRGEQPRTGWAEPRIGSLGQTELSCIASNNPRSPPPTQSVGALGPSGADPPPGRCLSARRSSVNPHVRSLASPPTALEEQIEVRDWGSTLRGRNRCMVFTDSTGRKLVFKHNTGGSFGWIVTDDERRRRDICNILSSRILNDYFSLPVVIYREARLILNHGATMKGVVCNYIEDLRYFEAVALEEISNPDQALRQVVALAWLGDLDRIRHGDNECVDPYGRYVTLDFDFCFCDGVATFGVPNASRQALLRFAEPDTIAPLIGAITALTDEAIFELVDTLGRAWVSDWTSRRAQDFAAVLIRNRKRLYRTRALYTDSESPRRRKWANFVARHINKLIIPKKLVQLLRSQGLTPTLGELARNVVCWRRRTFERLHHGVNSFRPLAPTD